MYYSTWATFNYTAKPILLAIELASNQRLLQHIWDEMHEPTEMVHQQLKCWCSICVVLCMLIAIVPRILMSCLRCGALFAFFECECECECRMVVRTKAGMAIVRASPKDSMQDNTIFTYDKNHSVARILCAPWKSITLTVCKWLIGRNLYSMPSVWCLFVYQHSAIFVTLLFSCSHVLMFSSSLAMLEFIAET